MLKGDPKLGFGRTDMKEQTELGENAKSAFDKINKSGGIDKKDFEKAKDLYMKKDLMGLKKYIRSLDTAPLEAVMDVISQNDDNAFMKMYPKSKKGQSMVQIAKEDREQVSEGKMGDYALVGKKDEKVVDVGRLKDMRNQRVKMGRNKYEVYPARGSRAGDTFVTTTCPPVNEDTMMNKDLIDVVDELDKHGLLGYVGVYCYKMENERGDLTSHIVAEWNEVEIDTFSWRTTVEKSYMYETHTKS